MTGGLLYRGEKFIRKAYKSLGDDTTFSRFVKIKGAPRAHLGKPKQGVIQGLGHPTIEAGRSIFFRKGVKTDLTNPLVSGHNNIKIGRDVRKGHLRGYWIYTLTLEERATCPRSCAHWHDCYGNHMPWAKRISHADGAALEQAIEAQIKRLLAVRGRRGVLVRLHALGDFYSVEYVQFWERMLRENPRLVVFGYTARWQRDDPIFLAIANMVGAFEKRAMIRASDAPWRDMSTVSIIKPGDCPPDAFVCPEQTGKVDGCGKCGACWGTTKNVAFLGH